MPVLNFKGKSTVYSHHLGVPFRHLKIDAKKSLLDRPRKMDSSLSPLVGQNGPSLDDNLIIQGDNLHALKALLPSYAGKVKCVYIDPPYNTGNEGWKYNDNVNSPVIKEWLGKAVGIDDLERHDKWLCMMWPRLQLLKDLLSDDGVIFVSIDDNEQFRLMAIMEEIFGEENFSTQFIWEKKKKPSFLHKNVGVVTDFILCFLKNKDYSFPFSLEKTTEGKKYPLNRAGNKESVLQFPKGSVQFSLKDQEVKPQDMSEGEIKTKLMDRLVIKNGVNLSKFRLKGEWGYSQNTLDKVILEGGNISISKMPFRPNHIRKGGEIKKMKNLLSFLNHYKIPTNEDATKEMINIFGRPLFTNPKPSGLIKNLIQAVTYNDKNAIILDSFAGSGTTAHAVLDLNKEDGGHRKFILVECEDYADKITAERVRRVIKGAPKAKEEKLKKGLGGSFAYCALGEEINEENLIKGKSLPSYKALSSYVYYVATGQTLDKPLENEDFYIGRSAKGTAFFVIYKPNIKFLRSRESALNLDRKEKIQKVIQQKKCKKAVVFAPVHYFESARELASEGIIFCQLPFAIYRIAGV